MALIREFAPAKINLTLQVLGKRADGYHELKSLVAFAADAGDVLTLDTTQPRAVTVSGPFAASIAGANLVETTLRLIAREAPRLQLGAVHLEKNLPIAAGIGGGSADAAAVIRAVQRANPELAADIDWKAVALRLGADVPVCLVSRLAWMLGIGEIVAPVRMPQGAALHAVVVNTLQPMPADKTAQVFKALRAGPSGTIAPPPQPVFSSLSDIVEFVSARRNDLSEAACRVAPVILDIERELENCRGHLYVGLSGGGPTCFALFDEQRAAATAAARISAAHPDWWVRATALC